MVVNFGVFKCLYLSENYCLIKTKRGDFVNLGVLFRSISEFTDSSLVIYGMKSGKRLFFSFLYEYGTLPGVLLGFRSFPIMDTVFHLFRNRR